MSAILYCLLAISRSLHAVVYALSDADISRRDQKNKGKESGGFLFSPQKEYHRIGNISTISIQRLFRFPIGLVPCENWGYIANGMKIVITSIGFKGIRVYFERGDR